MGHLLVVDDSPTIRKLVELTFRSTPWTVDFACSGREGIALASAGQPDIVLLDFVLPDMRGLEVCAMLAKEPRTQSTQVILMSAKDESIRQLFKPFPSVVDFVAKPFSSEELLARVRTASVDQEGRSRPPQRVRSRFSHAQKEIAAKALYSKLSKAFALIPSWLAQMGAQNPSAFFARKILSPDRIGDLLEALLPLYRELLDTELEGAKPSPANVESPLSGRVRGWPVAEVCTLFGASDRTGELRLTRENVTVIVYYRCGEIVLVTSLDPTDHFAVAARSSISASAEDLAAAEAVQAATGKPVHVTIAERAGWGARSLECERSGSSEGTNLRRTLQRVGRRLLFDAFDAPDQSFAWRDLASLPAYVEEYACYMPLSRNTEPFNPAKPPAEIPPSAGQLMLQRLREDPMPEESSPKASVVFDRVEGFGERMRQLSLDASERRVLALVDGRQSIAEIGGRTGLGVLIVRRLAHCLERVRLIAPVHVERPVMIIEDGVEGFQRSLESMLRGREHPIPLLTVPVNDDVVETALRELPRTVILNAESSHFDLGDTVRALRRHEELRGVSLVALLDIPAAGRVPELEAAGFDAVLVKPVAYADLERWI